MITGISAIRLSEKLTRCWVRGSNVKQYYTDDKYDKDATRIRYWILGATDPRVRCLPAAIETGVTDSVLG